MAINGWRVVWILASFDCPVGTAEERHDYTVFRRTLLKENFTQHQFSVYLKHFPTLAAAQAQIERLRPYIPEDAHVAFFFVTDKQYGMTKEFIGPKRSKNRPDAPEQLLLI
ncbi:MAG TPA: CRISPR-associated endonuclease Cas2 [Gammaproteobacteria bacterium]|nr:CRISPR-associated endonuclease Cas2 [Gammaproteobacteria bacterium]